MDDYGAAVRVGTIYLVLILFDGGLRTSLDAVRAGVERRWLATTTLRTTGAHEVRFVVTGASGVSGASAAEFVEPCPGRYSSGSLHACVHGPP